MKERKGSENKEDGGPFIPWERGGGMAWQGRFSSRYWANIPSHP